MSDEATAILQPPSIAQPNSGSTSYHGARESEDGLLPSSTAIAEVIRNVTEQPRNPGGPGPPPIASAGGDPFGTAGKDASDQVRREINPSQVTHGSGAGYKHQQQQQPPPSPRLQPTYRSTLSLNSSLANSPSRIKVRDLSHIQSFASEEVLARSRHGSKHALRGRVDGQQYEISSMPVPDIIEMVAGLLTKIITTNDLQHEQLQRDAAFKGLPPAQTSNILAFHGKNVPSITIASYLARIHKYCPTTYEVFISLLVYFDRMSENVKARSSRASDVEPQSQTVDQNPGNSDQQPAAMTQPDQSQHVPVTAQQFVVDSFNIHRLVMAGITCSSKFFSDIFYTNSRYAKVGGLPLIELNHLELQFLLINDFRLSVPLAELEAYGTMLVEFYANEIVNQQHHQQHVPST